MKQESIKSGLSVREMMNTRMSMQIISPETAEEYLTKIHPFQRNVNKKRVDGMVRDIIGGNFLLSPDCIAFDEDGYLTNGQHRLHACIESGIPIICGVIKNMPSKSFIVMDAGRVRSKAHALSGFREEKVTTRAAAVCRSICVAPSFSGDNVTNFDINAIYEKYADSFSCDFMARNVAGITAPFTAVMVLAHHSGVPESKLNRIPAVIDTLLIKEPWEITILTFYKHFRKHKTVYSGGGSPQNAMWFLAQRIVKAVDDEEELHAIYKNKTAYYTDK